MKTQCLPHQIDPERLARHRRLLAGAIPFRLMPRLCDMLESAEGEALVSFQFDYDEDGSIIIRLSIHAEVTLVCQRTLKPYLQPLDVQLDLAPIKHENQAQFLPANLEPLILHEPTIAPAQIVEDELILNLPLVPKDPKNDCSNQKNQAYYAPHDEISVETETYQPFAVLASLKKN